VNVSGLLARPDWVGVAGPVFSEVYILKFGGTRL